MLGATDPQVLQRAHEEDRSLVTGNVDDFVKLAQSRELHPGIVLVEDGGLTRQEQASVTRRAAERQRHRLFRTLDDTEAMPSGPRLCRTVVRGEEASRTRARSRRWGAGARARTGLPGQPVPVIESAEEPLELTLSRRAIERLETERQAGRDPVNRVLRIWLDGEVLFEDIPRPGSS